MRSSTIALLLAQLTSVAVAATTSYSECSTITKTTTIATATATSGCGKDHSSQAGKTSTFYSITNDGVERRFLVHVPSNYKATTKTGMILSFHGNNKNACYQEDLTFFSSADYNPNYIAVYPQGLGESWYGPTYHTSSNSDLGFVSKLLTTMRSEFCIDDKHIYATGKSNGGGFVDTIACDKVLGDNFAAFASVSGAFYTDANSSSVCNPAARQLPYAEFHGLNDTTIPYEPTKNGAGGPLPSIPDWLDRWAVRNGCTKPFTAAEKETIYPSAYQGVVAKTKYTCNGVEDIVDGYAVNDWQHWWMTTKSGGNLDTSSSTTIDATTAIMLFFSKWSKP